MAFNFDRKEPDQQRGRWQVAPRNYQSRREESRLLVWVGMLILVIFLMREVRNPQMWRWMWVLTGANAESADKDAAQKVDTRLRPPPEKPSDGSVIITGSGEVSTPTAPPPSPPLTVSPAEAWRQTQQAVWSQLLESVPDEDRLCFLRLLKAARDRRPPTADDRQRWLQIRPVFEQGWNNYVAQTAAALDRDEQHLTDTEKQTWRDTITRLETTWNERLQPALEALGAAVAAPAPERQTAAEIQAVLDALFLKTIRDNTVFTATEKDAWFRLLETLQQTDQQHLERSSVGHVGFVQLYKQPDVYRGKLVTVSGSVRLGYYREAPPNIYGISGYYMFWLKPTAGNDPLVVYSLSVPEGFPDVRALETKGRKPELKEDVDFTGYFFKRWAYQAEQGTRLAPVILAKVPHWHPAPLLVTPQSEGSPGLGFLLWAIAGTALFALAFAVVVYRRTRRSRPEWVASLGTDEEIERRLAALAATDRTETAAATPPDVAAMDRDDASSS